MLLPDASHSPEQTLKDANLRLEIARKQRTAKQFIPARANLEAIMALDLPDSLWQSAMLELAELAQEENELPQAVQVYNQYLARWPQDINVPEILLRQGLVYRRMGLPKMSLSKLYAVMTSALVLKASDTAYYQRLVLQAQTEIVETYLEAGRYKEARDSLVRLLKLDTSQLNRGEVQLKLVRCLSELRDWSELVTRAREYLERNPESPHESELRYLLATAFKALGRGDEAMSEVVELLRRPASSVREGENLAYWQQRAGNDIANQLYQSGDLLSALDIYLSLARLNPSLEWQLPVWYQAGLIHERLQQPAEAGVCYARILARESEVGPDAKPSLKALISMARWRHNLVAWRRTTEAARNELRQPPLEMKASLEKRPAQEPELWR